METAEYWKKAWEKEQEEKQHLMMQLASQKLQSCEAEKYRYIVENMNLGILEVDAEGMIRKINRFFCDMTGFKKEEIEQQHTLNLIFPSGSLETFTHKFHELKRGSSVFFEIQMVKKDGRFIWVLFNGVPFTLSDSDRLGAIFVMMDITDRRKLQYDLLQSKLKAEAAQKAEKDFLAHMSHEIRTPLNAIIGMSHLLYDTQPTQQQKLYLDTLKNAGNILHRLISDILDFSKIEAGGVEVSRHPFDMFGMLSALSQTFELKLEGSSVEFWTFIDESLDTLILGDELLLQRILLNLLGNAIKFTNKGSITFEVNVEERYGEDLLIAFKVIDTGIGIPKDRQGAIFEHFKQASSDTSIKYGGTGLGLAITKQLVDLQDGLISVESEPGFGTTFTVELPFKDTGMKRAVKNRAGDSTDNFKDTKELLIVEDNEMNRAYIGGLLKKWNIKYDLAYDGVIAVEMARKKTYDLIVMDIRMPRMNGYDATINIRNQKNPNQHVPIIALTASAMESEKYKALDIGMNAFLTKPFAPEQLRSTLNEFLKDDHFENDPVITNDKLNFAFNEKLDIEYLNALYEGDIQYAADMFETFLESIDEELASVKYFANNRDWMGLKANLHKIKPALSLVGLTDLSNDVAATEEEILKTNFDHTLELVEELIKNINFSLPIVKNQFSILKQFSKTLVS